MTNLINVLDKVANELETRGLIKLAAEVDTVANTLGAPSETSYRALLERIKTLSPVGVASLLSDPAVYNELMERFSDGSMPYWPNFSRNLPDDLAAKILNDQRLKDYVMDMIEAEGWEEGVGEPPEFPQTFVQMLLNNPDLIKACLRRVATHGFSRMEGFPKEVVDKVIAAPGLLELVVRSTGNYGWQECTRGLPAHMLDAVGKKVLENPNILDRVIDEVKRQRGRSVESGTEGMPEALKEVVDTPPYN